MIHNFLLSVSESLKLEVPVCHPICYCRNAISTQHCNSIMDDQFTLQQLQIIPTDIILGLYCLHGRTQIKLLWRNICNAP